MECSHREYLRRHNIAYTDVVSIGDVHIDPETKNVGIYVYSWDGPKVATPDDEMLKKRVQSYLIEYPELREEIKADWDSYQAYLKRQQQQALANQR